MRVLAAENDKAIALLDTLDDLQRKHALLDDGVSTSALGLGPDNEAVPFVCVLASDVEPGRLDVL